MKVVRYDHNPFVDDMIVPIKDQRVRLSRLGQDNHVVVNQSTGEVQGTHVTTFRRVDAAQFVKLFTQNIALTFDLKAAGIKAFNVLLWSMQQRAQDRDLVPLDKFVLEDFVKEHGVQLSPATFLRGLADLEKAKIIAKHLRQGWYYINPNFCFNGDRIAFTTVIERSEHPEQEELPLN